MALANSQLHQCGLWLCKCSKL